MKTTTVTELKNTLSAQLKRVAAGESLLVTDRNKPVAILRPLEGNLADQRISGLVAAGVVAQPRGRLDAKAFFKARRGKCGEGLSTAIAEERDER